MLYKAKGAGYNTFLIKVVSIKNTDTYSKGLEIV